MNITPAYMADAYSQLSSLAGRQIPPVYQGEENTTDIRFPVHPTADSVTVSPQGRELSRNQQNSDTISGQQQSSENTQKTNNAAHTLEDQKTQEDEQVIQQLKTRDQEVRMHEQAHLAAAGQYARSGASFVYEQGPDGKRYAIGGEVSIDVGKASTPEATINKMRIVRRAALAPAQPSGADRSIASLASAQLAQAQRELQQQRAYTGQDNQADTSLSPSNEANSYSPAQHSVVNSRTLMIEAYKAVDDYL